MFSDIVIPKNNETEFIEIASKLGLQKIYFLYDFNDYDEQKVQKKMNLNQNKKLNIEIGFIVTQKNLNQAFKKSKILVVKSSDKDRLFIESKKIKIIYGFEETYRKDYMHHRASGLNQIISEMARKYDVYFGFSYSSLLNKPDQIASLILGRMMQNIRICQKYKVKTILGAFSDKPYDLRASHDIMTLFKISGMDGRRVQESISYYL